MRARAGAARSGGEVQSVVKGLCSYFDFLTKLEPRRSAAARRRRAISALSEMVGSFLLVRASGDPALAALTVAAAEKLSFRQAAIEPRIGIHDQRGVRDVENETGVALFYALFRRHAPHRCSQKGVPRSILRRGAPRGLDRMLYIHHIADMRMSAETETSDAGVVGEITRNCLLTRTRRISRIITNIYDQALRPHGVNAPQFSLLVLIARLGGASRAEIGRANYQERSTLTRNLALLLSEGWVEEVVSKEGGRSRPIVISQAGRELLVSAAPAWRSAQAKARELLGEKGVAAIIGVADSIPLDELAE